MSLVSPQRPNASSDSSEPHSGAVSANVANEARSQRPVPKPNKGWRAWYELTKPRITQLMLITCAATMFLAAGGVPDLKLFAYTIVGLAFTIGGSSALNHVLDRDLDARMARTSVRPIPHGTISARAATIYGIGLFTIGGTILCLLVSPLTAWCGLFGGAFYVLVYTPLKRITFHNTVIGGVAGSMPPVVGWAAVTGDVKAVLPWTLFAIMFAWQPAHFWPLSLMIRQDYADAGFKMMPVTHGERATVKATWRWTWFAVATTLIPIVTRDVGVAYVIGAVLANAFLIKRMYALYAADKARGEDEQTAPALVPGPSGAGRLAARDAFLGSITWLGILFIAFAVDAFVGVGF